MGLYHQKSWQLENPMDRGAWQATVHRVAKSWKWLKQLSCMHETGNRTEWRQAVNACYPSRKWKKVPKVIQRSSGLLPRLQTEAMGLGQPWGHNSCLDTSSVSEEHQDLCSASLSHGSDITTPRGPKGGAMSQRRLFLSLKIQGNLLCQVWYLLGTSYLFLPISPF